jgi:CRISPR-associated protein Csh2
MAAETLKKSEIIFLYESKYSIPNGDPFTGEQRYDEETKKVLVSDVRIKRFIRDYFNERGEEVYVILDRTNVSKESKETGSAARMKTLRLKYPNENGNEILKKCIDVRLFGGIATEKQDKKSKKEQESAEKEERAINITGPVQFAILNPSLNKVDLRIHQNTTVFPSSMKNDQGSIGTTTVVPYSINQIHGWINPYSAINSGLKESDIKKMLKALWESINNANTRTKSNQDSLLLLQIVYSDNDKKIYGADQLIKINPKNSKSEEGIRSLECFDFDFTKLIEISNIDTIDTIRFYSDLPQIKDIFKNKSKFSEIIL